MQWKTVLKLFHNPKYLIVSINLRRLPRWQVEQDIADVIDALQAGLPCSWDLNTPLSRVRQALLRHLNVDPGQVSDFFYFGSLKNIKF